MDDLLRSSRDDENRFVDSPLTLSTEQAECVVQKCWRQIVKQREEVLTLDGHGANKNSNATTPTACVPYDRTVRVFISSTFADFHSEREVLMKQVFPELKELCEKHGLTFIEIDLRWGVPAESTSSETISTCLEEIDRCYAECSNPLFIALLGNRTRSSLEMIPSEQKAKFLDQDNLSQLQMTELKKQVESLFPDSCFHYEASFSGFDKHSSKEKVSLDINEIFPTMALRFLKEKIEAMMVTFQKDSQQKDEAAYFAHLYHCKQLSRRFVGRVKEMETANSFLLSEMDSNRDKFKQFAVTENSKWQNEWQWLLEQNSLTPLMVISGPKGCGKSAFLCKLTQNLQEKSNVDLFFHFVGVAPGGQSVSGLLKRLIIFCDKNQDIQQMENTGSNKLLEMWKNWLNAIARDPPEEKFVFIIDGLDQLDTTNSVNHIDWLPPVCPSNVAIVVSSRSEHLPTMSRLESRNSMMLKVEHLTKQEQTIYVQNFLQDYGKTVTEHLLCTDNVKKSYHGQLAYYYYKTMGSRNPQQMCARYGYHLLKAGHFEELVKFFYNDRRARMTPLHLKREYLLEVRCNAVIIDANKKDAEDSVCLVCVFCVENQFLRKKCIFCGQQPAMRPARLCRKHSFGFKKCLLCGRDVSHNKMDETVFKAMLCEWCRGLGSDHCSHLPIK